ncbi:MAG: hypothetical protein HY236_02255, partial [Acidobacteria bacterium]|nr:hypothetical protein [Acidobacteriota bacterium]
MPLPAVECTLGKYRAQEGLSASQQGGALTVLWDGDNGSRLRMQLAVEAGTPTVRELAVEARGANWVVLGPNLTPDFSVTTGIRRTNHGLPEEHRWDVYWDAPLNNPQEVRRATAFYKADSCEVRTDGSRLEISYSGVEMGLFSGRLQYTVYKGTNLIRLEAVVKTEEPSVAYIYRAGWKGLGLGELERVTWRDVGGHPQKYEFGGTANRDVVRLRAQNRLVVAEGKAGSIAAFPPPHQFFFARQLEINLGFVWYRKDSDASFSIGVRQNESHEGYNPVWIEKVWSLYNAPPGT